ncbi:P-type conjugative transfer protein TrbL [Brevundimonas aurantiaca]|jgi:type IV secretion system protein TrbL|uniref:Type IV secretion system protein TrbL n=1 Tax=Brevundimonas aurantiaca TaxID=74316 RepID=A0A7W9C764_9CAUL|nr:P-type conjugative transfer protein TrbL [Brevundimonas aurantiaca]MBB5740272.1 type IV secretion system protein TrbL [Brevundimonas aurantiaca]
MAGPGMETPNELMVVFSNTVTAGFDALSGSVNGVFGLLIALVVALTGIQWALSPNREVLASGFGKVLLIGTFAWIINDWQALSETLYAGFLELGLTAGGGSLSREEFLNPGAILQQGWEIVKALGETPAPVENPLDVMGNMADALILGLAMIGIMLAFAILALQIIVSLLEFKIVTLGGFVLLPFGIWNKTAFLAERPLGYVVSSGLKVLALAIVVSGARTIFDQLQPSANPDIYEALTILVAALLLAMLAIFIPNLASALVTGGPALGAGAALTSGLAVAGAGALVAGGVAGVGAMAGRAAAIGGSSRSAAGAASAARPSGPGPSSGGAPSGGGPRPSPGPGPGLGPAGRTRDPAPSTGGAAPTSGAAAAPSSPTPAPSEAPPPQPDSSGPPPGQAGPQAETRSRPSLSEDRSLGGGAKGGRAAGRSAALQAFFIANSGRALMPAGENSGALKPTVRSED